MDANVSKTLESFAKLMENSKKVSTAEVISFLDEIAKELNLSEVYVSETTGAKNHYLYPYVSHGPRFNTMCFNVIVMQDSDVHNFYNVFKENDTFVFDDMVSAKRNATAPGNLAYGYIEDDACIGFVSFQPQEGDENRAWTEEEKEIIRHVGILLKPLVTERQVSDRFAYAKNLEKTSIGIAWYYPKLKLIIVPENTMDKFSIENFVYREAPSSFSEDLAAPEFVETINKAFESVNKDTRSAYVNFAIKKDENSFYQLSLTTNRDDVDGNPLEIMVMIEKNDQKKKEYEEKADILKRYDRFRETISDNNHIEYYVNLLSGKMILFKADNIFRDCFEQTDHFDDFIHKICDRFVSPENKDSFLQILDSRNLRESLGKDRRSISLTSNFIIDGETKRFETVVVMNSTSIYDYTKDAMVFVRDVTYTEALNYDRLTGLLTMSHFLAKMSETQERLLKDKEEAKDTIIYYDFTQFKFFNLEYGVSAGDKVLIRFASVLRDIYQDAYIAHFGDDHFVVLDRAINSREDAIKKVEKTIARAKTMDPEHEIDVKAGICYPKVETEPAILVDYAQLACQDVKKDPLTSYREYDEKLKIKNEKRKYVIEHIDDAIENGWIKVYYQPVVASKNLSLVAMEGLTRWIDPKFGFLSPADFIPALEESNLIYKLDKFVVNEICKRLRHEIDQKHKVVPISFNLSRNDFLSCKPFEEVEKAIAKYKLSHDLICVEITESVTMGEPGLIHRAVDQFRNNGYEVWMDDFGSGYSSLNVLKDFNFDEIKVDMAFLRTFNEKSKIIVNYIVAMAKMLGIRTLTEGVETQEHVDFLRLSGCERLQGYYFSKPLPYEELMKALEEKQIEIKD